MRALVVGASAGVGRALSESLASRGDALLLVASDVNDLEAQAAHLRLVYGVRAEIVVADASYPVECLNSIRLAANTFGRIDSIFFPIGVSRSDDLGTLPLGESLKLINVNLVTIMGVVGHFLPDLLASNNGHIVGFGSVAGIRGRRANIIYSAAKRGLESYFESLRHLTVKTKVNVQFYKLGYVATQQSFGKNLLFPQVPPKVIGQIVTRNLDRNRGVIYLPVYWFFIAQIISMLPWVVFKRLNF